MYFAYFCISQPGDSGKTTLRMNDMYKAWQKFLGWPQSLGQGTLQDFPLSGSPFSPNQHARVATQKPLLPPCELLGHVARLVWESLTLPGLRSPDGHDMPWWLPWLVYVRLGQQEDIGLIRAFSGSMHHHEAVLCGMIKSIYTIIKNDLTHLTPRILWIIQAIQRYTMLYNVIHASPTVPCASATHEGASPHLSPTWVGTCREDDDPSSPSWGMGHSKDRRAARSHSATTWRLMCIKIIKYERMAKACESMWKLDVMILSRSSLSNSACRNRERRRGLMYLGLLGLWLEGFLLG